MATGAEAVLAIAKATGIPPATIDRASRILQDHRMDRWPVGKRGGGRSQPHVKPHHLVNLLFAITAADPITTAPTVADLYGSMMLTGDTMSWSASDPATHSGGQSTTVTIFQRALGGAEWDRIPLSGWLERMITGLAGPERESTIATLGASGFHLDLTIAAEQSAVIGHAVVGEHGPVSTVQMRFARAQTELAALAPSPRAPAALTRTVHVPFALFLVFGDLIKDTISRANIQFEAALPRGLESESAEPPASDPAQSGRSSDSGNSSNTAHGQTTETLDKSQLNARVYAAATPESDEGQSRPKPSTDKEQSHGRYRPAGRRVHPDHPAAAIAA